MEATQFYKDPKPEGFSVQKLLLPTKLETQVKPGRLVRYRVITGLRAAVLIDRVMEVKNQKTGEHLKCSHLLDFVI